jgi:hypothetical protein
MDWPEDQIRISIFFSLSASVRSDDPEAFSSERIRKHVVDVVNKAYGPYPPWQCGQDSIGSLD